MESILQKFLSSQIINVDEDENHQKLIKASKDLVKLLEKDKSKFQKVVLSCFDSNISTEDPYITETKKLIIKHWSTFVNKCQDMPLTYIRAVMLEALSILSTRIDYAAIIWLSLKDILKVYNIESREEKLLNELLIICGNKYENTALKEWSFDIRPANIEIEIKTESVNTKLAGVKNDYLVTKLAASVANGNTISNNPSYGSNTVQQGWANEFGKLSNEAIMTVINTVIKQTNEALETKASNISYSSFIESFNEQATSMINSLIKRNQVLDLRAQLLWFKESLYSNSQNDSYSVLPIYVGTIAISFDYSDHVPNYYPTSVEFLLAETVKKMDENAADLINFSSLLDLLDSNKEKLTPYFINYKSIKPGRVSLTEFIGNFLNEIVKRDDFVNSTGIPLQYELSWISLAKWLFRDLQALKIINKK